MSSENELRRAEMWTKEGAMGRSVLARRSPRRGLLISCAVALVAVSAASTDAGYAAAASTALSGGAGLKSVSFGAATCSAYYYQFHIGLELGFFEDEGLDVSMECIDGSSAVAQQLAVGNVDLGGAGTAAVLPAYEAGQPLYPFMVTDYGLAYELGVPPDSERQAVADMQDARIGVSELSGAEVPVIRSLLVEAGLDPDVDVQMIEVGTDPAAVLLALERGAIDAVGATAGDLGILNAAGIELRSVISDEQREELSAYPAGALFATEELAQDPETLAAFGRAAAKGFLIAYTNPDAAICIMAEVIPEEFVDPEAGRSSFEGALEFTTAPQNPDGTYNFSAGNDDVDQWNRYIEIYVAGGLISEAFDMGPYIVDVNDEINDFDQAEVVEFVEDLDSDCEASGQSS